MSGESSCRRLGLNGRPVRPFVMPRSLSGKLKVWRHIILRRLIPLTDPFAVLQISLTQHVLQPRVLIGAGIILAVYAFIGGRTWCALMCPINMVTELAASLRRRLGVRDTFSLSRHIRYTVLVLALVLSALMGRLAQVQVGFNQQTSTHWGECAKVCPETHVLNLHKAAEAGMVA